MRAFAVLTGLTCIAFLASLVAGELVAIIANGAGCYWFWRKLRQCLDNSPHPITKRESRHPMATQFKPRNPSVDAANMARDAEHFDRDMRSAIAKYAKETSQP